MPEAPPRETYYVCSEKSLFHQLTLEVRFAYRHQGFLPAAYPHVADDHVAIELDFLARLAERAEASWETKDIAAVLNDLAASEEFSKKQLAKWASDFADVFKKTKYAYFYQETAAVLAAFLPVDLDVLAELKDALT
jgi:TorA maturation chaperone TorD